MNGATAGRRRPRGFARWRPRADSALAEDLAAFARGMHGDVEAAICSRIDFALVEDQRRRSTEIRDRYIAALCGLEPSR